jgi:membrane protease YdiL (CAAX protease family)
VPVTALLYALPLGVSGGSLLFAVALGCGLVWCGLRGVGGGLWSPILCHLIWDIAVLLAAPLEAGGTNG